MKKVTQVSVFAENSAGQLHQVLKPLAAAGVNLRAFSVAEAPDFGVLRFIVDDPDKALKALEQAGFRVSLTPVLAVELEDKPGALESLCGALAAEGINIDYMYAFVGHDPTKAVTLVRTDDLERTETVLEAAGFRLLDGAELLAL